MSARSRRTPWYRSTQEEAEARAERNVEWQRGDGFTNWSWTALETYPPDVPILFPRGVTEVWEHKGYDERGYSIWTHYWKAIS